jgi:hypothetical protein
MTARKANSHDFKRAKGKVLEKYARRHSLRKGTKSYNAYRYGSVSRRMAGKAKRGGRAKRAGK